jgi:hypothetical protein
MSRLSQHVDRVVNWLKWPVAVVAVVLLPNSVMASLDLLRRIVSEPRPVLPLLGGLVLYVVLWWCLFRRPIFGSFLSTLEHELTHALFALATFHKVTGLRASWRSGGHMTYQGSGNWLITIAPYFFPTICLFLLAASVLLPQTLLDPIGVLMGATIAYHVTSTYRETHAGQSDLNQVGWLFCLLFLPTANLLSYGVLLSFCYGGTALMQAFLQAIFHW